MRRSKTGSSLIAAAVVSTMTGSAAASSTPPTEVIDRHLVAYNSRNVEAFLAFFAPDAEIFEFPDKSLAKGTAALRERYTKRFADPILHATIANRTVVGNKVIDHEKVRITWPEGPGTWDLVAIYEVKDGLIARVWFIYGAKTVDSKK